MTCMNRSRHIYMPRPANPCQMSFNAQNACQFQSLSSGTPRLWIGGCQITILHGEITKAVMSGVRSNRGSKPFKLVSHCDRIKLLRNIKTMHLVYEMIANSIKLTSLLSADISIREHRRDFDVDEIKV